MIDENDVPDAHEHDSGLKPTAFSKDAGEDISPAPLPDINTPFLPLARITQHIRSSDDHDVLLTYSHQNLSHPTHYAMLRLSPCSTRAKGA